MTKDIDPAHASSVLQVLPIFGVSPSDVWAEVQRIIMPSGEVGVAFSVRLVLDDGLMVRHVSAIGEGESVESVMKRVADSMREAGLRSIDLCHEDADTDEDFHTVESVRKLMAETAVVKPRVVH